ncbi:hypothetical protein M2333_000157 [Sphingobium sp. B11D3B]|nr:hypothetical protein [Sphingobium sp. B11D3B]MCW2387111.1 hypothetical protein [Sphingobium sp. B11D3B]
MVTEPVAIIDEARDSGVDRRSFLMSSDDCGSAHHGLVIHAVDHREMPMG